MFGYARHDNHVSLALALSAMPLCAIDAFAATHAPKTRQLRAPGPDIR